MPRLTAAIASSGEMRYARSRSGIEPDHDRALVAAERRRRRDAGQRGEQRPHAVERDVLHLARAARLALEKTSWPTGTLPASKRMMNGGTAPGGMKARARLT